MLADNIYIPPVERLIHSTAPGMVLVDERHYMFTKLRVSLGSTHTSDNLSGLLDEFETDPPLVSPGISADAGDICVCVFSFVFSGACGLSRCSNYQHSVPPQSPKNGTASEPPSGLMWGRSTAHVGHEIT